MTDTPRDTHSGSDGPPLSEPLAGKAANSVFLDKRLVLALDLIGDTLSRSRSQLMQAAIREYLERRGYRAEWRPDLQSWRIEVKTDGKNTGTVWHRAGDQLPDRSRRSAGR